MITKLHRKQNNAIWYMKNPKAKSVREVLYGGAAGAGKSALIAFQILEFQNAYPKSRQMVGRYEMKNLRLTTIKTLRDIADEFGVRYKYSENSDMLFFPESKSELLLKDLKCYPGKDPNYDSLGSLEISRAYIDEIPQIPRRAIDITMSRIRYKLNEFDIMPKLFMTCNPAIGHANDYFYEPWKNGELPPNRAFIRALPRDNPYLPESYLQSLLSMNESDKQRLYYGNWEFQNDPFWLVESIDKVTDMIHKMPAPLATFKNKYITIDPARMGKDEAVILVWSGWDIIACTVFETCKTPDIVKEVRRLAAMFGVPTSNIIADQDGVGGGVVDGLSCIGFVNNATPFYRDGIKEQFNHLKSQCAFYLAERINNFDISTSKLNEQINAKIKKELYALKQKSTLDGKKAIIKKDEMKNILGISPGFLDAMLMRSYFDLVPVKGSIKRIN